LFETAARAFADRTIAVVPPAAGSTRPTACRRSKRGGGIVIAQDPRAAHYSSIPARAVDTGAVGHVLPLEAIAPTSVAIMQGQPIDGAPAR